MKRRLMDAAFVFLCFLVSAVTLLPCMPLIATATLAIGLLVFAIQALIARYRS